MSSGFKKFLYVFFFLCGCLAIYSAFASDGVSIWMRIRDFALGILIISAVVFPLVRWFCLTICAIIGTVFLIIGIFQYSPPGSWLCAISLFVSITLSFYFGVCFWDHLPKRHPSASARVDKLLADYPNLPDLQTVECEQSLANHINETEAAGDVTIDATADWQEFHRKYTAIDYLRTKVVGVTFNNDFTGINRQHILFFCKAGDTVSLNFYRYNGAPAYAVMTKYGQIGNLSASFADTIYNHYDQYVLIPQIKEITGGAEGYPYGCVLQIAVYQKNKDLPYFLRAKP